MMMLQKTLALMNAIAFGLLWGASIQHHRSIFAIAAFGVFIATGIWGLAERAKRRKRSDGAYSNPVAVVDANSHTLLGGLAGLAGGLMLGISVAIYGPITLPLMTVAAFGIAGAVVGCLVGWALTGLAKAGGQRLPWYGELLLGFSFGGTAGFLFLLGIYYMLL